MTGKGRNSLSYSDRTRIVVCSVAAGLIYALCLFFGKIYAENRLLSDITRADFLYGFKSLFLCSAASLLLISLVEGMSYHYQKPSIKTAKVIAAVFFILSWIVYIPVFLAVYPGIYGYDASSQLMQLYHTFGLPLTTHHPLIHTFYLGLCMEIGGRLFHSYQAGMALYSLSQVMAMICIFDFVITRLYLRGLKKAYIVIGILFLTVNPYIVVSSFLTTKDILFGGIFIILFEEMMWIFKNSSKLPVSKFDQMVIVVSGTMMCLFRNQGIYVFLLFLLFAIPAIRQKRFVIASVLVVVLWGSLSIAVPKAMHIEGGDPREMLSVPMQQMSRVYCNYPEVLDKDEKNYIEEIISEQGLKDYCRLNADPVKAEFDSDRALSDKGEFLGKWAEIGMKKPDAYVDSFLMMCQGYWYPLKTQYWISVISYDGDYLEQPYNIFDIRRMSRLPELSMKIRELVYEPYFDEIPFLGFIFNQAFPFWMAVFSSIYFIFKKRYKMLIPMLLIFGYWGTLLLGPVTVYRYTLAMVYSVPVMLGYLLIPDCNEFL